MEKYKLCGCGEKNSPTARKCKHCGKSLAKVQITDDEQEQLKAQNEKEEKGSESPSTKMVRICDCGHKNPANVRVCEACGEEINDIIPQEDTEEINNHFILSTIDGEYAYELFEKEVILGREHEMKEYLSSKKFVSRKHARIFSEDGRLFIQVFEENTNPTFINDTVVESEEPVELKDGDELGLGSNSNNGIRDEKAAYFTVRIGECNQ